MPSSRAIRACLALSLLTALLTAAPAAAQPTAVEVEVASGPNEYKPATVEVEVGQPVVWTWTSGTHSVTADDRETFDSGNRRSTDEPFTYTPTEPGTIPYFCMVHSSPGGTEHNGTLTVVAAGEGTDPGETPPVGETPPAAAEDPADVDGTDPVATALAWSALLPDGGTSTVLIGTSERFPDSLASGTAQGTLDAPLLLTPTAALDPRVAAEIERLGAGRAVILGGINAVSQQVQDDLGGVVAQVDRVQGADRRETARQVADVAAPEATTVIMARAEGEGSAAFADSLGAGSLGRDTGWPVLLVGATLDDDNRTWLEGRGVTRVVIAGGEAAVPATVATSLEVLGIEVSRQGGRSRTETAAALFYEHPFRDVPGDGDVALVDGDGDLAWASGFAAALHSPRGILLARSSSEVLPADTGYTLLATQAPVRCGPTLADETCRQADLLAAASFEADDPGALTAVLDAGQEVPPVEAEGSGVVDTFVVGDALCATGTTQALSGSIVAAHIHRGGPGVAGDVVAPLLLAVGPNGDEVIGCSSSAATVAAADVTADPAGFYVNLHTAANPGGEVRGQLFSRDFAGDLVTTLEGGTEVPGPGHPDALGSAVVYQTGVSDELCYSIFHTGLDAPPAAAHIHEAPAGESGPIVVPLVLGPTSLTFHCERGVDPALVEQVMSTPDAFYVNLHTPAHPAGAIRGQLTRPDSIVL